MRCSSTFCLAHIFCVVRAKQNPTGGSRRHLLKSVNKILTKIIWNIKICVVYLCTKSNNMLKVRNYEQFKCFNYENEPSPNFQLGDIVFKENKGTGDSPEIGIVIQTFSDGDFRTDMFGMASESEVIPASFSHIKKYRPSIMDELMVG
jgi:hypothetical protein